MDIKVERIVNLRDKFFNEDSVTFEFYNDGDVTITLLDEGASVYQICIEKDKLYKSLGVKEV